MSNFSQGFHELIIHSKNNKYSVDKTIRLSYIAKTCGSCIFLSMKYNIRKFIFLFILT
jgi:hypothetical protein